MMMESAEFRPPLGPPLSAPHRLSRLLETVVTGFQARAMHVPPARRLESTGRSFAHMFEMVRHFSKEHVSSFEKCAFRQFRDRRQRDSDRALNEPPWTA